MYLTSTSFLSRGKIGVGFSVTLMFQSKPPKSSFFWSSFFQSSPSCSNILTGLCVITGAIKIAIKRKLSAKLVITLDSSSLLPSLFNVQGVVSSIYLFAREMSFQTLSKAWEKWRASICFWYSAIVSLAVLIKSFANSSCSEATGATWPSWYWLIIETVLFNKLPKSLAKSKLTLSTKSSGVKIPSEPNGIARIK